MRRIRSKHWFNIMSLWLIGAAALFSLDNWHWG
jgi:hypothetical protein